MSSTISKKKDNSKYMFKNVKGQILIKKPGDIAGTQFKISDLDDCEVYLLDHIAELSIDRCKNCKFFIGPIKASVFMRTSTDCSITVYCGQFRCRDLK